MSFRFAPLLLLPSLLFSQTTPPPVSTSITVTEHISAESPADVTDLTAEQISQTPGTNLDDRLRFIPGFSLFRRTSSEVANPTTQGISLRGIGSTGASRTLVLFDGVPFNDPFGGWVYWTRFTPEDLNRVEVSRGASTSLFGDLAMGGAINIFPLEPPPSTRHISAGAEAGTQSTFDVWGDYTQAFRNFAVSGTARGFTTDGFYVVPGNIRGTADRRANVHFINDSARVDWFSGPHRVYAWVNSVVEERANGTSLTHNSTAVGTAAVRYLYQNLHDAISVTGFGTTGEFHSTYSSVSATRNFERLVSTQTVPESSLGGAGIYTHNDSHWDLNAGADAEQDRGFSTDRFSPTNIRTSGGSLLAHGEFVQTDFKTGPVTFFLGGRHQYTGQNHQFFTPSAGISAGHNRWRARGSFYRAYRTPTLNELFREFRVGNTDTLANPQLQPETLLGVETGADYVTEKGALHVTAFHNDLHNLITNVTLSATANAITRQRENAGNALGRGFEIGANRRWRDFNGQASYLFADSRYTTGLRVPQVPRSQGSATLGWSRNRTFALAGIRSSSSQFDDDQNHFLLPGFAVVQLVVRQQIMKQVSASLEITNLLDRTFYTGYTPTPTIGDPRILRGGILWKWN
jgi:outer membrane cobalamin receptor